jgi:hypothetical protein
MGGCDGVMVLGCENIGGCDMVQNEHFYTTVIITGVLHTEIWDHSNSHYCLAFVKSIRQFATVFANNAVIISHFTIS